MIELKKWNFLKRNSETKTGDVTSNQSEDEKPEDLGSGSFVDNLKLKHEGGEGARKVGRKIGEAVGKILPEKVRTDLIKKEAVSKLQKIIEKNEKIIEAAAKELEEIEKRIGEKGIGEVAVKKELGELKIILKENEEKNSDEMVRYLTGEIKLLENSPVEYFKKQLEEDEGILNSILEDEISPKNEKMEAKKRITAHIEEYKIIIKSLQGENYKLE